MSKIVLFHREFKQFSGGHLKVWHYFRHLQESDEFTPTIYFSNDSVWNSENPWFFEREKVEKYWNPNGADVVFLAGLDWKRMDECKSLSKRTPIVNLIQHIRHAESNDIRYRFLSRKAVRICVSEQVAECLRETRIINGPLFTIKNGIDINELPTPLEWNNRKNKMVVFGLKNKEIAIRISELAQQLNLEVKIELTQMPRMLFLDKLRNSKIALLLPNRQEGFYLPVLEAMALDTLVICPDCIGNRSFCLDGVNSFRPEYTLDEIFKSALRAYSLDDNEHYRIIRAGGLTVLAHSFFREKQEFLSIMKNLYNIW